MYCPLIEEEEEEDEEDEDCEEEEDDEEDLNFKVIGRFFFAFVQL